MTKTDDLTAHLRKVVDDHIRNVPYYSKLISGEENLPNEYGAYVEQIQRIEEVTRITSAIHDAFNELDIERRPFVSLYYFNGRKITSEAAGQRIGISRSTALRWKDDFIRTISKKLGWI